MENDWPTIRIEEIQASDKGAIAIGPFGSRMKSDCYVDKGIPVIRGTNMTGGPTFEGDFVFITEEKATSLGSSNVFQGDLVFPHRGSIGEVGIIRDERRYVISSSLMKLTCDTNKVYPLYLYYFFKSSEGKYQLLKNASQVGTPGIGQPLSSLKSIYFKCPPLPEQKRIAHILGTLDDKIELNRQTNQTLESMAQAMFKSWFVDFDPVIDNALAAGKTIPEPLQKRAEIRQALRNSGEAKSLPAHIQKLFPDSFRLSDEMGWVPEGWEATRFNKIVEKYIDNRGKTPPLSPQGIPLVEVKHLPENSLKPDLKTSKYVSEETFNSWFRAHPNPDDIIISTVGTIGRICLVPNGSPFAIAQNLLGMRFNRKLASPYYMYYQMDGFRFRYDVDARLVVTVQQSIKRKDLETIDLLLPNIEVQNSFENQVKFLVEKQGGENSTILEKLRDTLLPKLISGELRIPEAKTQIQEVVA